MPWTYMLRCADGSYYAGSTRDLERRLWEHNYEGGASYTRGRRPVTLVRAQWYDSVTEAYLAEKQIQNWGRAKREALIAGRYELLPRLARGHGRSDTGSGRSGEDSGGAESGLD